MPQTTKVRPKKPNKRSEIHYWPSKIMAMPRNYWRRSWLHKVIVCLIVLAGLGIGTMYGIARWYMASQSSKPLVLGTSFIPDYARSFGLDPKQTLDAFIHDLGVKRLRFVGYWDTIEPTPGRYDFSELDWQMKKAEDANVKVSLSLGLRQPRWPECHPPKWADTSQPMDSWYPQLKTFIGKVVERYKDSPALDSYQLENEYFLSVFGECKNFSRDRLIDEFYYVKGLDSIHPVVISRSNNALGTPINEPVPDEYGVSVYKRVWDTTITKRYIEYPFPAWFYGFLAGTEKIIQGKDTIIHELQAEPWPPHGKPISEISLAEQDKSMNATRLKNRVEYGKASGMKTIDLWGAEWWYWRKVKFNDPSLWNAAKEEFKSNSSLKKP